MIAEYMLTKKGHATCKYFFENPRKLRKIQNTVLSSFRVAHLVGMFLSTHRLFISEQWHERCRLFTLSFLEEAKYVTRPTGEEGLSAVLKLTLDFLHEHSFLSTRTCTLRHSHPHWRACRWTKTPDLKEWKSSDFSKHAKYCRALRDCDRRGRSEITLKGNDNPMGGGLQCPTSYVRRFASFSILVIVPLLRSRTSQ